MKRRVSFRIVRRAREDVQRARVDRCKRTHIETLQGKRETEAFAFKFDNGWYIISQPQEEDGHGFYVTRGRELDLAGPEFAAMWAYRIDLDTGILAVAIAPDAVAREVAGGRPNAGSIVNTMRRRAGEVRRSRISSAGVSDQVLGQNFISANEIHSRHIPDSVLRRPASAVGTHGFTNDRLSPTIWPSDAGRQKGGEGLWSGAFFYVFERMTDGWPRCISGVVCLPFHDEMLLLKEAADLFAWIASKAPVEWKRGARAVSKEEFFKRLHQRERWAWASPHPHFPPVSNVYYLSEPPKPKNTGKLDALVDRFLPKTSEDRALIKALVLTLYWGGPPGKRPQFVIVADEDKDEDSGRGTGKTTLVQYLSELVGGCIDVEPSGNRERVCSNLLSPGS
jgi:hypothetical protein